MSLLLFFKIDLSPRKPQTTKSFLVQIVFWATSELSLHREKRDTFIAHGLIGLHLANHIGNLNSE